MATHSYISTTFWDDAWIQELDPSEKLVYMYLMTNPLTNIIGVYKITDRRISFDTGLTVDTVKTIIGKFTASRKAVRFGEWVILPTWPKHQSLEKDGRRNDNLWKGFVRLLSELPDDVFDKLREVGYRYDLNSIPRGKKKESNDTPPLPAPSSPLPAPSSPLPAPSTILLESYSNSILSEFKKNFGGDSMPLSDSKISVGCEQPVDNSKKPPPNLYKIIKEKAKAFDFYLDDFVARKIERAIPESSWFTDGHSIIEFVAQKIADIYSGKPKPELKNLFISALTSWENIRDEYPDWLRKQNRADELRALEMLRNTPPKTCPHCGQRLKAVCAPDAKAWCFLMRGLNLGSTRSALTSCSMISSRIKWTKAHRMGNRKANHRRTRSRTFRRDFHPEFWMESKGKKRDWRGMWLRKIGLRGILGIPLFFRSVAGRSLVRSVTYG